MRGVIDTLFKGSVQFPRWLFTVILGAVIFDIYSDKGFVWGSVWVVGSILAGLILFAVIDLVINWRVRQKRRSIK